MSRQPGHPEDIRRDYQVAFLRYLDHGEEAALADGYDLGRRALRDGVPLLELAQVHHETVIDVLSQGSPDSVSVAAGASSILLEVLAPYEMNRRATTPQNPADAKPTT
jgi:hypothetical protein